VRLAEIFVREVPRLLIGEGLLGPDWAERILSRRHTGFNVQEVLLDRKYSFFWSILSSVNLDFSRFGAILPSRPRRDPAV
jgi:hypothetical protein